MKARLVQKVRMSDGVHLATDVWLPGSSFPRILPHPNTMAPTWKEASPQVAQQQVFHSPSYPSRLALPVLKR
jgi:predicted acyl esterase